MKFISTPKLLLLAFASTMLFSCSVNDDDQLTNDKMVQPEMEQVYKAGDSTYSTTTTTGENEPVIPKPRG